MSAGESGAKEAAAKRFASRAAAAFRQLLLNMALDAADYGQVKHS